MLLLMIQSDFNDYYFFFKDSSTTEIDTYYHTLPLHDALPISGSPAPAPAAACRRCSFPARRGRSPPPCWPSPRHTAPRRCGSPRRTSRLAEHTSELPSLMRSSYAVFCLKKKNKTKALIQ